MTRGLFIFLVMAAPIAAASAQTTDQPVIYSAGNRTCVEWTEQSKAGGWSSLVNASWLNGFLSAYNVYGPGQSRDIKQGIDFHRVVAWVDQYCEAHPEKKAVEAALELVKELRQWEADHASNKP